MENPPFWWHLPGKMGIFLGYVSLLLVSGMVYVGHGHLLRISRDPHWPLHSLKMDAWKTILFPFAGGRGLIFFVQGRTVAEKNMLVLGRVLHVYYTNSYKPSLVTWKGLQCRWYYVTWPYKLQSPSSWVIAPGELGKGSRLAGPWRIDSWNFRIWSRKKTIHFFGGKNILAKNPSIFCGENILAKNPSIFFWRGGKIF